MALTQQELQELLELFPNRKNELQNYNGEVSNLMSLLDNFEQDLIHFQETKYKEVKALRHDIKNVFSRNGSGSLFSQVSRLLSKYKLHNLEADQFVDESDDTAYQDIESDTFFIINTWVCDVFNAALDKYEDTFSNMMNDLDTNSASSDFYGFQVCKDKIKEINSLLTRIQFGINDFIY